MLIIVLIVIGVKLYHRNLELDDLYDEYGIDLDDDDDEIPETPRSQKTQKAQKTQKTQSSSGGKKKIPAKRGESKPAVRVPVKTMNLREEFDDFDEDDDYDDSDDYYDDDDYDYDSEDSSEMIDDLDELLSKQPKKKRGHMEKDDAFQVDFIDLDE